MPESVVDKSTNGRSFTTQILRAGFGLINHFPSVAGRASEALFFTPSRQAPSRSAREFLATGRLDHVRGSGERLAVWSWGEGPTVILVHGWGGRGSQLAAFVPPLVASGFRVVAFDAPGHGASSGSRSSAVEFARGLEAVAARLTPVRAIIAHSLGSTATALALRKGLEVDCVVLVGPPADPVRWIDEFAREFRVGPAAIVAMRASSERRLNVSWSALALEALVPPRVTPLLVIHDREDREVPFPEGVAVSEAWGGSLVATSGLGHRRILRDPGVVRSAVSFIVGRSDGQVARTDCLEELQTLERYLYDPEAR
jgi:pimeloyl-ACP methyl ester carboxylesterase